MLTTQSQVATQNTGLYKTEPQPKEAPPPDAQQIPKFKDAVKPEKLERVNKRIHKTEDSASGQCRPLRSDRGAHDELHPSGDFRGDGWREPWARGTASASDTPGMWRRCARASAPTGCMATVSPNILTAPRVYLTFEILRDGTVTNVQITQSSGIPEVDRSALRAILASNPLPPLPSDYSGGSVNVQFYFDFHRQ